jgi:hypothetical protein
MRFIKLGIISVVVITVVLFAISFSLPQHVRISRAINIEAPADSIMPYLKDLEKWIIWNSVLKDSSIKTIKFGKESIQTDKFSIYSIASVRRNWAGTRWVEPGGREFQSSFELTPGKEFTAVQWYFDFYFKWYRPWEKFGSIIYDKRMGPSLEQSLVQLKALVESSH